MGFRDNLKAFARVGAGKGTDKAAEVGAKAVHKTTGAASKGAASLNDAADHLQDDTSRSAKQGEAQEPDGGASR